MNQPLFFPCVEALANYMLACFEVGASQPHRMDGGTAEDVILEVLEREQRRGHVA